MSFLDQLKERKSSLKPTVTNITHADGSQEQLLLSTSGAIQKMKAKTYGFVVDTKPDFVPACIVEDFLYLGSQDSVIRENVDKYQLTDILSVGIETPAADINNGNHSFVQTHFVECLDLPETNLATVTHRTSEIIKNIRDRNGRVLVHCNAGVSRSSAVCIAFLMSQHEMKFENAFALVKSKRECIRPNDGFLKQLEQMDQIQS